jgi:hypothetical protein
VPSHQGRWSSVVVSLEMVRRSRIGVLLPMWTGHDTSGDRGISPIFGLARPMQLSRHRRTRPRWAVHLDASSTTDVEECRPGADDQEYILSDAVEMQVV